MEEERESSKKTPCPFWGVLALSVMRPRRVGGGISDPLKRARELFSTLRVLFRGMLSSFVPCQLVSVHERNWCIRFSNTKAKPQDNHNHQHQHHNQHHPQSLAQGLEARSCCRWSLAPQTREAEAALDWLLCWVLSSLRLGPWRPRGPSDLPFPFLFL